MQLWQTDRSTGQMTTIVFSSETTKSYQFNIQLTLLNFGSTPSLKSYIICLLIVNWMLNGAVVRSCSLFRFGKWTRICILIRDPDMHMPWLKFQCNSEAKAYQFEVELIWIWTKFCLKRLMGQICCVNGQFMLNLYHFLITPSPRNISPN